MISLDASYQFKFKFKLDASYHGTGRAGQDLSNRSGVRIAGSGLLNRVIGEINRLGN